IACDVRHKVTD
ncbi:hypothetical protein D030_0942B, partial [Vibrio parahaemolyticus AQ3810]